jgi:mono/diheme cytochrome c family protein
LAQGFNKPIAAGVMTGVKRPSLFALAGILFGLALVGPAHAASSSASAPGMDDVVKPFFTEHCISCHGEKKQKGDLRVDTLTVDLNSPKVMGQWMEILGRVTSGEMPPEKRPRPRADDIARVSEWIANRLRDADAARQSSLGDRIAFHRLSREEYTNTIRDLLGIQYDAADPSGLPEDPDWQGFQRIGSVLTLSPTHVEKYLSAAEMVLGEALPAGPPPKRDVIHWSPFDLRGHTFEKEYTARGIADQVRVDLVPNNGALDVRDLNIKVAGEYIVRVKLSGLRPAGGRPPRLRLYAGDLSRVLVEQDVEAPEDKPTILEFKLHLPVGVHPIRIVNAVPGPNPEARRSRASGTPNHFTGLKSRVPWQIKFTDDDYKPIVPFLLLDYIEWEGPIVDSWPTPAHRQIFFGGEGATKDSAYARLILARFAERAFRHPVPIAEVDRLVKLFEQSQELGDDFESSVKTALLAVLCSKSFLYLEEGSVNSTSMQLTDWELASRLSYFLWSSMPDPRLIELARAGKLHEPDTLKAEVRRMLADPKAEEFAQSFPRQWLQLRRVGMFPPDKVLYPDYDESLEESMIEEPVAFFGQVLRQNLSLKEFLDSDWTMLNERLAGHYGIKGVVGDQMRRVSLTPEDHRGGVLTQAAVLSLTSDGTRHRPVHRGVWILESILGTPPPPPPANVPPLNTPPPNAPKTTLRQKLELHRADANCAACHRKIDPLGMAFDNYDAIGRWRTEETLDTGSGANPKLDPSGELPDGRKFNDAKGLKQIFVHDIDKFAGAMAEKLATYAMRRGMTFTDKFELKKVARQAKADDYRLSGLIEALVTSEMFRRR